MSVTIVPGDIVREKDGLAMSSRNSFISAEERPRANQLQLTLSWVCEQIRQGRQDYIQLEVEAKEKIERAGFKPDYLQVCCSDTLLAAGIDDLDLTVLGAMYTKAARLIDNVSLSLA